MRDENTLDRVAACSEIAFPDNETSLDDIEQQLATSLAQIRSVGVVQVATDNGYSVGTPPALGCDGAMCEFFALALRSAAKRSLAVQRDLEATVADMMCFSWQIDIVREMATRFPEPMYFLTRGSLPEDNVGLAPVDFADIWALDRHMRLSTAYLVRFSDRETITSLSFFFLMFCKYSSIARSISYKGCKSMGTRIINAAFV